MKEALFEGSVPMAKNLVEEVISVTPTEVMSNSNQVSTGAGFATVVWEHNAPSKVPVLWIAE